ncbi:MAG: tRNA uridine-5-carboxymethylaminomethyl(34) synthesis GTPase MnmE, partial [Candidatus Sumerlaeaceae bacterium]|nr:tRNA uridine-5-carboxymethylaminomethyl(34) synthesis GTPase MnmE [Candidatus Sumerlaeaceae bacterium]
TSALKDRRITLGRVEAPSGELLDEALAVAMHAPHSFTGEHVAELHLHGSRAVVAAVLDACVALGARLAEPGEFSRRAFLNRRLDLAQAEAVADLVAASSEVRRKLALRQLQGGLSNEVRSIRDSLVDAAARIEAHLDFPDEEIPAVASNELSQTMADGLARLASMLKTFEGTRMAREGIRVVLAGAPNAGKSSLFNELVGRERAIVTPHPGTTRDTIESTLEIGGVAVTIVDTAGVRESADSVEQIGIERTWAEVENADVVLVVMDAETPDDSTLKSLADDQSCQRIILLNKCDLVPTDQTELLKARFGAQATTVIACSALTRQGLEPLETALRDMAMGSAAPEEMLVANARQATCLRAAQASLLAASASFSAGLSGELVMVDLRDAIEHVGEVIGLGIGEDILDRIFSTFCIGK